MRYPINFGEVNIYILRFFVIFKSFSFCSSWFLFFFAISFCNVLPFLFLCLLGFIFFFSFFILYILKLYDMNTSSRFYFFFLCVFIGIVA